MSTKITASIIVDTATPSADFIPTGDFEVVCKVCMVILQKKIDGAYYSIGDPEGIYSNGIIVQSGTVQPVVAYDAGSTYRLFPTNGRATAEAWQI